MEVEYLRELIRYFIADQNINEEDFGGLFESLSLIYQNAEKLSEGEFSTVANFVLSTNPSIPIGEKEARKITNIADSLLKNREDLNIPTVEFAVREKGQNIFMIKNSDDMFLAQEENSVKGMDFLRKNCLLRGGIDLLFKRW